MVVLRRRYCRCAESERGFSKLLVCAKNRSHEGDGEESIMANLITLYHGTIYEYEKIDVTKGKGNKDFGRGFYTSRDIHHTERLATRNKFIEEERFALRGMKKNVTRRIIR